MLACMNDSAHDKEHVYRVLYMALEIAQSEPTVDMDILLAACLLHDIGRERQFQNPQLCHAQEGAAMAYDYLITNGWSDERAGRVRDCIASHRYRDGKLHRSSNLPQSIEARVLFDADKLDVTGTLGIARTLLYKGQVREPIYTLDEQGQVQDGTGNAPASFFQEYQFKLIKLYDRFYTARGREIAQERRALAVAFYEAMLHEVRASYEPGRQILGSVLS